MSWDQIPKYVEDRAEENYQNLKPVFFPNLTPYDSKSNHAQIDGNNKEDKIMMMSLLKRNTKHETKNMLMKQMMENKTMMVMLKHARM